MFRVRKFPVLQNVYVCMFHDETSVYDLNWVVLLLCFIEQQVIVIHVMGVDGVFSPLHCTVGLALIMIVLPSWWKCWSLKNLFFLRCWMFLVHFQGILLIFHGICRTPPLSVSSPYRMTVVVNCYSHNLLILNN